MKKQIDPEYGVDSRYKSKEESIEDGKNLLKSRFKKLTKDNINKAKSLKNKLNDKG
jgi:hypothetical protein